MDIYTRAAIEFAAYAASGNPDTVLGRRQAALAAAYPHDSLGDNLLRVMQMVGCLSTLGRRTYPNHTDEHWRRMVAAAMAGVLKELMGIATVARLDFATLAAGE